MGEKLAAVPEKGLTKHAITALCLITGLYQLYVAAFGTSSTEGLRITHWLLMGAVCFLIYPTFKKKFPGSKVVDWLFVAASSAPGIYLLTTASTRMSSIRLPSTLEVILGVLLVLTVLETARRTAGLALALIASTFLGYALWGHLLPGVLSHREYSLGRVIQYLFLSADGVYGVTLGVSATYIVLFVLFGSFLSISGAGQLFIDAVVGLTGKANGGPAKAAVVSSALMGMISGSPVANVVTVGTYTIPLMVKTGMKDYEAASVEAVASTGGMIMPPIMGAAAFIMADYLGVPYSAVAVAAAFPSILYFGSLFFAIHYRAKKTAAGGLALSELPDVKAALKARWFLLIPVVMLVVLLAIGWSATKSALAAILMIIFFMVLSKDRKQLLNKVVDAIEDGVKGSVSVASACAVAGIVVGVINQTGLGVKFSSFVIGLSGGQPLLILLATMVACLIMGMGLPPTAVYILLATLAAPALIKVGFTAMAAHMFVFYFGIIGAITPPVALSAFAAAGIAKSDPYKTGWHAFRLGLVAYFVPFMFAYNTGLLMDGSLMVILKACFTALVGVMLFAIGTERYLDRPLPIWETVTTMAIGILLMIPEWRTDIAGWALLGVWLVLHYIVFKPKAQGPAHEKASA